MCVCVCFIQVFYGRTKQRFPRDIAQEVCPRPIAHRLIRRGYSSLHKSLIADFQWAIRHAGQPLAGAEGIKRRGMHVNTEDLLLTSAKLQLPTSETVRVIPASPSSKDVHIRTYIRTYICMYVSQSNAIFKVITVSLTRSLYPSWQLSVMTNPLMTSHKSGGDNICRKSGL